MKQITILKNVFEIVPNRARIILLMKNIVNTRLNIEQLSSILNKQNTRNRREFVLALEIPIGFNLSTMSR